MITAPEVVAVTAEVKLLEDVLRVLRAEIAAAKDHGDQRISAAEETVGDIKQRIAALEARIDRGLGEPSQ